jgi:hypothetical protein
MTTPTIVAQQIRDVTSKLVLASLVDHQNAPTTKVVGGLSQIGITGSPDMSISLRDIPYDEVYNTLHRAGAYHMRMLDGALIQMLYSFSRRDLHSHRLCYFPAPSLATFDDAPELYEEDEMFADIFSSFTVKVPIRIDFEQDDAKFIDIDHPKCHASLGQYKDCRIPVEGPLTPLRFMRFILRNFYNKAYVPMSFDDLAHKSAFAPSITNVERRVFHISG